MKSIYFIILALILFTGCSESILSDVEITNPQLLKVKVKIEQNESNEKEVQVFIRDSKNHPIDLLTGKVIVNNHTVNYDRASVNSAAARGYIYIPHNDEQVFKITIYWNEFDYHSFILSPANGWPGFYCNTYHCCDDDVDFISDSYKLKPAPFFDNEIAISYHILDIW